VQWSLSSHRFGIHLIIDNRTYKLNLKYLTTRREWYPKQYQWCWDLDDLGGLAHTTPGAGGLTRCKHRNRAPIPISSGWWSQSTDDVYDAVSMAAMVPMYRFDKENSSQVSVHETYRLKHRPSIIEIVSKIIMFCDKSNMDNKTVYTLYVIQRFMKKSWSVSKPI
jgi:hypothetical protein